MATLQERLEDWDGECVVVRFGTPVEELGGLSGTGVDLGTIPYDMSGVGRPLAQLLAEAEGDGTPLKGAVGLARRVIEGRAGAAS